jgi:hypothetical protein
MINFLWMERALMHTVTWIINPNEGTSRQDIEYELEASKADYAGGKGLVRMLLGISADDKSVIEISLWESKSAAESFFSPEWETGLSRRWQAAPMRRQDWDTPAVV